MYENIGGKIKTLAKVSFWVIAIASIVVGVILAGYTKGISLLGALMGAFLAWISTWTLYGFGEIIDKLNAIEKNTRNATNRTLAKTNTQTQFGNSERIRKLENLYAQGLITEEEYQQAIAKEQ